MLDKIRFDQFVQIRLYRLDRQIDRHIDRQVKNGKNTKRQATKAREATKPGWKT